MGKPPFQAMKWRLNNRETVTNKNVGHLSSFGCGVLVSSVWKNVGMDLLLECWQPSLFQTFSWHTASALCCDCDRDWVGMPQCVVAVDRFYVTLFPALKQTHWTLVACDSKWVTAVFCSAFWISTKMVHLWRCLIVTWLVPHETAAILALSVYAI